MSELEERELTGRHRRVKSRDWRTDGCWRYTSPCIERSCQIKGLPDVKVSFVYRMDKRRAVLEWAILLEFYLRITTSPVDIVTVPDKTTCDTFIDADYSPDKPNPTKGEGRLSIRGSLQHATRFWIKSILKVDKLYCVHRTHTHIQLKIVFLSFWVLANQKICLN